MNSKRINDGGPAFPVWELNGKDLPEMTGFGLSLRQYYAAKALQGMLAHPTRYRPRGCDKHLHWHDAIAKEAHELADAMLKALEGE